MNTKRGLTQYINDKFCLYQFIVPKMFFTYIDSYPYSDFTNKKPKGQKI